MAIPHKGNLPNGRMFALTTFAGEPLTKAWANARRKREPLVEVIQMKGQGEAHPAVSTTDEFAQNFELRDRGNLDRIQIIEGWGDKDRRRIVKGRLTPVGNTVDVARATWTNTIGDPELITAWTAHDAAYLNMRIPDPKVPMTTRERAITSPIWYSP